MSRDDYLHDKPHRDEICAIYEMERMAYDYLSAGKITREEWAAFCQGMDFRKGVEVSALRLSTRDYVDAKARWGGM